jgi:hypothetical protein
MVLTRKLHNSFAGQALAVPEVGQMRWQVAAAPPIEKQASPLPQSSSVCELPVTVWLQVSPSALLPLVSQPKASVPLLC